MEFNTKQELYNYLNNFDFNSVRDTELSSVYFLVEFNNHIEPIHFMYFEDVWFESPCCLSYYLLENKELTEFVKEIYKEDSWEKACEFEKTMQKNGYHYEINCPQCAPFLPDKIRIIDAFSDIKCLDWLLQHRK